MASWICPFYIICTYHLRLGQTFDRKGRKGFAKGAKKTEKPLDAEIAEDDRRARRKS